MLRAAPASLLPMQGLGARAMTSTNDELELLESLLKEAKRRALAQEQADLLAEQTNDGTGNPKFQIQTFNAISPVGLQRFPKGPFVLTGSSGALPEGEQEEPHAILLRSHKLKTGEVASSVRAVARCGAGTNNVPIAEMTARGIPVFNTPGANANGVKELVLCGLFLASRGVVEGINHTTDVICAEEAEHEARNARVEKDKSKFAGQELQGRTLAVLGLGNIGAMVADAALALGMNVVGFDPMLSVDAAWRLSSKVEKMDSLDEAFAQADYVSVNMPYIKGVTHHIISDDVLSHMKPTAHLVNFARGELVDGAALERLYKKGHVGKYISDFPDAHLQDHPKFTCIPHLGASTGEAEDNCARMAADQARAPPTLPRPIACAPRSALRPAPPYPLAPPLHPLSRRASVRRAGHRLPADRHHRQLGQLPHRHPAPGRRKHRAALHHQQEREGRARRHHDAARLARLQHCAAAQHLEGRHRVQRRRPGGARTLGGGRRGAAQAARAARRALDPHHLARQRVRGALELLHQELKRRAGAPGERAR